MPSAINVGGRITRRPGVYASVDTSALTGVAISTGRVAIVADIPVLAKATPQQYSTPRSIRALKPGDTKLELLAKYLYNPAKDDRVSGGPGATILVSPTPTTQALLTLQDGTPTDVMILRSTAYGAEGNKTIVVVTNNAVDSTLRDMTISRSGISETYTGMGSGILAKVWYTGSDHTTGEVSLVTNGTANVIVAWTKDITGPAPGGTVNFVPSQMKFDGLMSFDPDIAPGAGESFTVTVTGTNKVTGLADTEQLVWSSADGTDVTHPSKTTTKFWSDVSNIAIVSSAGAAVGPPVFTITGAAFGLSASDYPTVADAVAHINSFNARGYFASNESPRAAAFGLDTLDNLIDTDIVTAGAAGELRADRQSIIDQLNSQSGLVTAEATGVYVAPPAALVATNLAGGTQTTASATDWRDALDALQTQDVQIIAVESTDTTVHSYVRDHCVYMAGEGQGERNAWVPLPNQETKANVKSAIANMNTRHMAAVAQEPQLRYPDGTVQWADTWYMAVLMAGMQVGTPVATPLTRKLPNVLDVRSNAGASGWNPDTDADEMLEAGLCFVSHGPRGELRVERSITTYVQDDNPVFSEVSANESLNTSIRDLRANLDLRIGDPNKPRTRGRIESQSKSILREQVNAGFIKAFNEAGLEATDQGDRFRVDYEVAVVEPVNFIDANVTVTRTPFGG